MMLASLKGALIQFQRISAPFVLSLLLLSTAFSVVANPSSEVSLKEIDALATEGMSGLSLALLKQSQPSLADDPSAWKDWQQRKILIYQQQGNWRAIIAEFESLQGDVPDDYRDWLLIQVIKAYLANSEGEEARDLLLAQIWHQHDDREKIVVWRRLVIHSYLIDGRNKDAYTAMLRYQQDNPAADSDEEWLAIKARVLIASDYSDEAVLLTVSSQDFHGQAVHVLARLKGLAPLDKALLKEALGYLNTASLDQEIRQALATATFEKANSIISLAERISVLEQLLGVSAAYGARVTAVTDALWYAYSEYGNEIANRLQLLVGNFKPWFVAVDRLQQSSPLQARAILAWLATRSDDDKTKAEAHVLFVTALNQHDQAEFLLRPLYLSSSQFTEVNTLPSVVMFHLVDKALADADLGLASKLMSHIDAPEGFALIEWQLRRARVQVLAGGVDNGAELLKKVVAGQNLSRPQMERIVEVVFDLQNAGAHAHAYDILADLLDQVPEVSLHRQLLIWMADSQQAQQYYAEAARLYLRAAGLMGSDMKDSWTQSAQYQAALALENAGLVDDAISVYKALLDVASSPERHADLRRQVQRLVSRGH